MSDTTQHNSNSPDDDSFEAADAVPISDDDMDEWQSARAPIDLDAPIQDYVPGPAGEFHSAGADGQGTGASSAEVEALRTQAAEANDKYLRTLAEFQNYRRRTDEDIRRRIQEGNEKLIQQILPSLDDFDLAIAAAQKTQSFEQLIGGVEAIYRKLTETLNRQGVEPITALGEKFDTSLHEAVMLDEESDQPDETVTAELRRGYTMKGRVIRPALVKVAKAG
jgi:molecular chaperone GrpE